MNTTVYILGILLQSVAAIIALLQVRHAPRKLPWLLIALSSLLIVVRRIATLEQFMKAGRELAAAEILTLIVSVFFFLGVIFMSRMFRDILADNSARKRAEEALRASSHYSRNLLETSLDPLVTINANGKITDVNMATEKITGVSRERLIGSDFSDYFTEPEKARNGYMKVFDKGQVIDYPLAVRNVSGAITEVLYNASVYRNEQGEILGVFAAARDITERKRAEEALRAASRYSRNLIETSLDPLVTISANGKITDANTATEKITGIDRERLIGSDFSDYFTDPKKSAGWIYESIRARAGD